jgi:hypothetical protein
MQKCTGILLDSAVIINYYGAWEIAMFVKNQEVKYTKYPQPVENRREKRADSGGLSPLLAV